MTKIINASKNVLNGTTYVVIEIEKNGEIITRNVPYFNADGTINEKAEEQYNKAVELIRRNKSITISSNETHLSQEELRKIIKLACIKQSFDYANYIMIDKESEFDLREAISLSKYPEMYRFICIFNYMRTDDEFKRELLAANPDFYDDYKEVLFEYKKSNEEEKSHDELKSEWYMKGNEQSSNRSNGWYYFPNPLIHNSYPDKKLYISLNSKYIHEFARELYTYCIDHSICDLDFKISDEDFERRDNIVIYCSNENMDKYAKICQEIIKKHPEYEFNSPQLFGIQYDEHIFYGADPKVKKRVSYTNVLCDIINKQIKAGRTIDEIMDVIKYVKDNVKKGKDISIIERELDEKIIQTKNPYQEYIDKYNEIVKRYIFGISYIYKKAIEYLDEEIINGADFITIENGLKEMEPRFQKIRNALKDKEIHAILRTPEYRFMDLETAIDDIYNKRKQNETSETRKIMGTRYPNGIDETKKVLDKIDSGLSEIENKANISTIIKQ